MRCVASTPTNSACTWCCTVTGPLRNDKPLYSGGLLSEYIWSANTRARLVGSQEIRQALLPGLLQHGQVAAVDDLQAQRARLTHQIPVAHPPRAQNRSTLRGLPDMCPEMSDALSITVQGAAGRQAQRMRLAPSTCRAPAARSDPIEPPRPAGHVS